MGKRDFGRIRESSFDEVGLLSSDYSAKLLLGTEKNLILMVSIK